MTGGRTRTAAVAILLFCSFLAFAQDGAELPFPFVSLLKAESAGFQVKLSWRDSPDKVAKYTVYRYDQEITASNLASAQTLGQVDPGVLYFIDTPPDDRGYFYAVLAQDSAGKLFSALIPFRNKTLVAVAVMTPATEEQLAAHISAIHAVPTQPGDSIEVSFDSSSATRDLLIFRSTAPVTDAEDLLRSGSATQLDAGTTKTLVPALPGVDYWFTVLDAGLYRLGRVSVTAGANSTVDPVQIPLSADTRALAPSSISRRTLPLPSLDITYGIRTGTPLPGTPFPGLPPLQPVSAETQKALSILLAAVPEPAPQQMYRVVLPAEATPSPDRNEALLQGIIKGPFSTGDAAATETQLLDFLSLIRPADTQARAHFYLGQTYFFNNQPREALLEFLLADDSYYHEAERWKDACFQQLEKEDN